MENTTITYKAHLDGEPAPIPASDYLNVLRNLVEAIYDGAFGIHLAPKILVNNTPYFFPILEISKDPNLNFEDGIKGAVFNTSNTIKTLTRLGAGNFFKIIVTGEGGFRLISRKALPLDYHRAFQMFVRLELPQVQNVQADTLLPLLTYLGHPDQVHGTTINRHAVPMDQPWHDFGPETYLEWVQGTPDPVTVISFMEWLLRVEPVTEISTLDKFGERLIHYKSILASNQIIPFSASKFKRAPKPLSLEAVQNHLKAKGIQSKIEKRGSTPAISFDKLPCPSCSRSDVRAWAYPPFFRLQCFNSKCEASIEGGIPLIKWAGIVNDYEKRNDSASEMAHTRPPEAHQSVQEARNLIRNELANNENVLLLVTPGVGKTHETLHYLATQCTGKTVLYSCLNRDLKNEAYKKCLEFAKDKSKIHNIQPREDLCLKKHNLSNVTGQGYSPAQILCRNCNQKSDCKYQRQKTRNTPGVYFVTHPMLEYLENTFPAPDLIILDENLLRGFVAEETASESDMRTLLKVLKGSEAAFIQNILQIGSQFASQIVASTDKFSKIVNGRRISKSDISEDTILDFYARQHNLTESQVEQSLESTRIALAQFKEKQLFKKGVNFKAVEWVRGLSESHPNLFSYLEATPKGNAFFKTKRLKPLGFNSTPVKILDATGHPKLAKALTNRNFRLVRADVAWNSRRIHIKQKLSRTNLASMRPSDLEKLLKLSLEKITADKVLVLTHKTIHGKDFKDIILNLCQSLAPGKSFQIHHFFGPRGINNYKDCEAVLVIGNPIANLNSTWQEASILFPGPDNEEIRDTWVDLSMNWELIQCLHRVRPIYNPVTDIVMAGDFWTPALPDPVETIDESRDKDKFEKAVERLKPFFKEFGFMNRDLAMLAGVYQKRQESLFYQINEDFEVADGILSVNDSRVALNLPTLMYNTLSTPKVRLSVPCLLYTLLIGKEHLTTIFNYVSLSRSLSTLSDRRLRGNENIIMNHHQFELVIKELYGCQKQIASFKIKSGFGGGHTVNGIGLPGKVEEFYSTLNEVCGKTGLFKNTDLSSVSYKNPVQNMKSLPKGVIVAATSQYSNDIIHIAWDDKSAVRTTEHFADHLSEILHDLEESKPVKIITNNGKLLARMIIEKNLPELEIHDVMVNERILNNGLESSRYLTMYDLCRRYGSDPDDPNSSEILYEIWEEQMEKIQAAGLSWVADLEKDMIWVVAQMEFDGMEVDGDGFSDWLEADGQSGSGSEADKVYGRIGPDGRFHDEIDQMGEVSARMISKLDRAKKVGPFRSFFRAGHGRKFIIADYKQQEPRILAGLSKDEEMLRILNDDDDIYETLGNALCSMVDVEIERQDAKKVVNALNYWCDSGTIFKTLRGAGYRIRMEGAVAYFDSYRVYLEGLFSWQNSLVTKARKDGFVATAMGRRRYVDYSITSSKIINYAVQGTAADAFKDALRSLRIAFNGIDARIVHTMRDGLIIEAETSLVEQVMGIVQGCMENAFAGMVTGVKFPVDITVSDKWT